MFLIFYFNSLGLATSPVNIPCNQMQYKYLTLLQTAQQLDQYQHSLQFNFNLSYTNVPQIAISNSFVDFYVDVSVNFDVKVEQITSTSCEIKIKKSINTKIRTYYCTLLIFDREDFETQQVQILTQDLLNPPYQQLQNFQYTRNKTNTDYLALVLIIYYDLSYNTIPPIIGRKTIQKHIQRIQIQFQGYVDQVYDVMQIHKLGICYYIADIGAMQIQVQLPQLVNHDFMDLSKPTVTPETQNTINSKTNIYGFTWLKSNYAQWSRVQFVVTPNIYFITDFMSSNTQLQVGTGFLFCNRKFCQFNQNLNIQTGECVSLCPVRTYKSNFICQKCHQTCFTCNGVLQNQCQSCLSTDRRYLQNSYCKPCKYITNSSSCISQCPEGTFQNSSFICQNCHSTCFTCNGLQQNQCESCAEQLYLQNGYCTCLRINNSSPCIKQCPEGTFNNSNSICQNCHSTCLSCFGNQQYQCLSCDQRYLSNNECQLCLWNLQQSKCVQKCVQGTYQLNFLCQYCHYTCLTCYGGSQSECLSCLDIARRQYQNGYCQICLWDDKTQICVNSCTDNQYISNNVCMQCSQQCIQCSDIQTCYSCQAGYFLLNYVCLQSCPLPYYNNIQEKKCTQCKRVIIFQLCMQLCPIGYYQNGIICSLCSQICLNCIAQTQCIECKNNLTLYEYSCLEICPNGHYQNSNQVCIKCEFSLKNCLNCVQESNCLQCKRGFFLQFGICNERCSLCNILIQRSKIMNIKINWENQNETINYKLTQLSNLNFQPQIFNVQRKFDLLKLQWNCQFAYNYSAFIKVWIMAGITNITNQFQINFLCLSKNNDLGLRQIQKIQDFAISITNIPFYVIFWVPVFIPSSFRVFPSSKQQPPPLNNLLYILTIGSTSNHLQNRKQIQTQRMLSQFEDKYFLPSIILAAQSICTTIIIILLLLLNKDHKFPQGIILFLFVIGDKIQQSILLQLYGQTIRLSQQFYIISLSCSFIPLAYFLFRFWRLQLFLNLQLPSLHYWQTFPQFALLLLSTNFNAHSLVIKINKNAIICQQNVWFIILSIEICIINTGLFNQYIFIRMVMVTIPIILFLIFIVINKPFINNGWNILYFIKFLVLGLLINTFLFTELLWNQLWQNGQFDKQIIYAIFSLITIIAIFIFIILQIVSLILFVITIFIYDHKQRGKAKLRQWYLHVLLQNTNLTNKDVKALIAEGNLNYADISILPNTKTWILKLMFQKNAIKLLKVLQMRLNNRGKYYKNANFNRKIKRGECVQQKRQAIKQMTSKLWPQKQIKCISIYQIIQQNKYYFGENIQLKQEQTVIQFENGQSMEFKGQPFKWINL